MEAALIAFQIATLERLLFFFYGAIIGLALGAMARLGGLIELAILLPFTFDTTNRISSVLFGPDVFHFNVDVPCLKTSGRGRSCYLWQGWKR